MYFVIKRLALVSTLSLLYALGNASLAATNCGFLTLQQCRAAVSGIGGFCVPNQFYNPQRSTKLGRKAAQLHGYQMPYDPNPWCAEYSERE